MWGWDSQVTNYGPGRATMSDFQKVFVNNGIVFGVCGSLADAQKLAYAPIPDLDTWDRDEWVTSVLNKKLKKRLEYSECLISVQGRVYAWSDGSWVRSDTGVYAAGSGADIAFGAIMAGASIREALEIASEHDPYTGGTLQVKHEEEILDAYSE